MQDTRYVKVGGSTLKLTHLNKILFPETGTTKWEMLQYYRAVAPVLLPHLRGRPITLKRYPEGSAGNYFYEKRCPAHRPEWIRTISMSGIDFCGIDDMASLIWAANLGSIELHPYLCREPSLERADHIVFDLDPGAPAGFHECCETALLLRELLGARGLKCYPKTSGSKGLQLYLPLASSETFTETKSFARSIAEKLEKAHRSRITSRMAKALRPGKVFIDWSQNDQSKTTVSVYSLRALPFPSVSTPVDWSEIEDAHETRTALFFRPSEVLQRIRRHGDLFAPLATGAAENTRRLAG